MVPKMIWLRALGKVKKCAGGRALLQGQMENLNDGSLHENPFDILDEDVIVAAPAFNVIEEDDVDDDLDI